MSYINSALKKVQKDRDSRYISYGDIIAARRDNGNRSGRLRVFVFPVAAFVIVIVIAIAAWFFYQRKMVTAKVAVAIPRVVTVAPPAVAPAVPQEDVRAKQLYEAAAAAQRGKQWGEAESLYKQVLSLDPRHVHSLNNLGVLFMSQKRYDEATELFVKAMAAQEDYVDPYYNLACLYSQLDNPRAGLGYLERAIKINGKVREWAKDDADFRKLRKMSEFKKITEELVK